MSCLRFLFTVKAAAIIGDLPVEMRLLERLKIRTEPDRGKSGGVLPPLFRSRQDNGRLCFNRYCASS
jgi:hypothetical protein